MSTQPPDEPRTKAASPEDYVGWAFDALDGATGGNPKCAAALDILRRYIIDQATGRAAAVQALISRDIGDWESIKVALQALGATVLGDEDVS